MSQQIVAAIKTGLELRGQRWQTNEDAFQITARVAWALRDQGAMLILKRPEQNGAVWGGVKYSHDAIAFPAGWIDCLISAGPPSNENGPSWNGTGMDLSAALAHPFDLGMELLPDNNAIVIPPPDVPPASPADLTAVAAALREVAAQLRLLRDDLRQLTDVGMMDFTMIAGALAQIEATQARGLTHRYLGALTVPPPPKP